MARDQVTLECPAGQWTELSNSDAVSFNMRINRGGGYLRFTNGAIEPAANAKGLLLYAGVGIVDREIASMTSSPGANRIWFRAVKAKAEVFIDHA